MTNFDSDEGPYKYHEVGHGESQYWHEDLSAVRALASVFLVCDA